MCIRILTSHRHILMLVSSTDGYLSWGRAISGPGVELSVFFWVCVFFAGPGYSVSE